jgi:hypothetical protein
MAKLAGLRVILIVDNAKHGLRLSDHSVLRPDLLVDSHDPVRAAQIIRANTKSTLRLGIDTQDRTGAVNLLQALIPSAGTSTATSGDQLSHLVCLAGAPKLSPPEGTVFHSVPIKIFHEVASVGQSLVLWLERLLQARLVVPPEIIDIERGLDRINAGLDRMRRREISGGKLIVKVI